MASPILLVWLLGAWHLLVWFMAGFAGFAARVQPAVSGFALLACAVVGVWQLGWWALLSTLAGFLAGSSLFLEQDRR